MSPPRPRGAFGTTLLRAFPERSGAGRELPSIPRLRPTREQSKSLGMASSSRRERGPRHSRSVGIRRRSPGTGPRPREFSAWQKRTRKNQPGTAPGAGTRMEPELRTRDGTRGRDTGTTRRKHNQEHRAGHARWEIPRGNSPALPIPRVAPSSPRELEWEQLFPGSRCSPIPAWGVLPEALEATGISWNHCWRRGIPGSRFSCCGLGWLPWGIGMEQDPRSSFLCLMECLLQRATWEPPPWGIMDGSQCIHGLLGLEWGCSAPLPSVLPTFPRIFPTFSVVLSPFLGSLSPFLGSFPAFPGVSPTLSGISSNILEISPTLPGIFFTFPEFLPTLPGISLTLPGIFSILLGSFPPFLESLTFPGILFPSFLGSLPC